MKTQILAGTLVALTSVAPATLAGHKWQHGRDVYYDYAQVVSVEPIMRTVEVPRPRRECWQEEVRYPATPPDDGDGLGGLIIGGVIGGVVGNQIGKGSGRDAATVAGTIIGASIGHEVAKNDPQVPGDRVDYMERCRVVEEYTTEEHIDAYRVTYHYRGEAFNTRMNREPGSRIRVRVHVTPLAD